MPRGSQRFFVENLSSRTVTLTADEAHHALDVLRLKAGAEVELFDGRGGLATGTIAEIGRRRAAISIKTRSSTPRSKPIVRLCFAVPKGSRLDWLLEKATELGAASLEPVIFERSVAGGAELTEAKRRGWLAHCLAAAKQCCVNWLPEIRPPVRLEDFLACRGDELRIVGHAGPEADPLAKVLTHRQQDQTIRLLIGPEGGLTHAELAAARDADFLPARLGQTTLRTETAAIALLAATVAACGE